MLLVLIQQAISETENNPHPITHRTYTAHLYSPRYESLFTQLSKLTPSQLIISSPADIFTSPRHSRSPS